MNNISKITPLILCGGFGRRLWPVSRPYWPKPLVDLGFDRTLLQETAARFKGDAFNPPVVICNEEHRFGVAQQLEEISITPGAILLEHKSAGTAAAVLCGIQYLLNYGAPQFIAVTPADHMINPINVFQDAVITAANAASTFDMVMLGIPPRGPNTNFGYIDIAQNTQPANTDTQNVRRFIEKPTKAVAKQLLKNDSVFWNAGIFVFDLNKFSMVAQKKAPGVMSCAHEAYATSVVGEDFVRLGRDAFAQMECKSFDIEVVEKCDNLGMVPLTADWHDIGTWQAIWEATEKDAEGNVNEGNAILYEATNNLIMSDGPNIAVGKMNGIAVIVSGDSVIVCPLSEPQLPATLSEIAEAHSTATVSLTPAILHRVWGSFEILASGATFVIKKLTINPGKRISLQRHKHRSEHWVVLSGTASVTIEGETFNLEPNQSVFVCAGQVHRLANDTNDPVIIVELQIGDYLGEDDIERIEDDYERV